MLPERYLLVDWLAERIVTVAHKHPGGCRGYNRQIHTLNQSDGIVLERRRKEDSDDYKRAMRRINAY